MNTANRKIRLPELDALRGFAALMVVIFHLSLMFIKPTNATRFGLTGVNLFFIISGFVVPLSINNVKSGKEFVVNRFARLYPVYWVCLTLSFLTRVFDLHFIQHHPVDNQLIHQFLVNFTMIQYYFGVANMEDPYWSLIVELVFYVVVFVVYKLKRLPQLVNILFTLVVLQGILRLLELEGIALPVLRLIFAAEYYFPLANFLPLFLIGTVFYNIAVGKAMVKHFLIIFLCVGAQVLEYSGQPALAIFNISPIQYATAICIFIVLFLLLVSGRLKFISNPVTLFLGRISYALYLFHQYICVNILIPTVFMGYMHFSYLASCAATLMIIITLAAAITIYIDEPIRYRIKKQFLHAH